VGSLIVGCSVAKSIAYVRRTPLGHLQGHIRGVPRQPTSTPVRRASSCPAAPALYLALPLASTSISERATTPPAAFRQVAAPAVISSD
jgi:hypothetical protein